MSGRDQETKQPVPAEIDFQYPPTAPPTEEDSSIWIAEKIPDDASNTDNMQADTAADTDYMNEAEDTNNTDETEDMEDFSLQTESPSPAVPIEVPPATTRPATIRPTIAKSAQKAVPSRRKKPSTVIPAYIVTRPGMTLRSLAWHYFGSEVFWIYIYDRNIRVLSSLDTSSFDALPSGIELELPRPADYGIDATEPISLQRACKRAKSLEKQ